MRVLFVTGTNTGVGKTVVTGLITAHSSSAKAKFRALKPFCSGDRGDALLLWELQERQLALDEINRFYFAEALSPWTAARRARREVSLQETLNYLTEHAKSCELLIVEGAGGLLSPLGVGFTAADLIRGLRAEVVLVAANCLGVLNHVALTIDWLVQHQVNRIRVALVDTIPQPDELPAQCNEEDLRLLFPSVPLVRIAHLSDYTPEKFWLKAKSQELAAGLATLLRTD